MISTTKKAQMASKREPQYTGSKNQNLPLTNLKESPRKDVGASLCASDTSVDYFPKVNVIENLVPQWNISKFVQNSKTLIVGIVGNALMIHPTIEYNIVLSVTLINQRYHLFGSKFIAVKSFFEIEDTIDVVNELITQTAESHKTFTRLHYILVNKLVLNIRKLPIRIGTYMPLPRGIAHVTNVKNVDNFCFKWAILCAVAKCKTGKPRNHFERPGSYGIDDITSDKFHQSSEFESVDLDFSGLVFPLEVRFCRVFEEKNPHISVNVFGLNKMNGLRSRLFGPLYRTRREKEFHINLLYFEDPKGYKSHYAYIGDLSAMLHGQFTCNTCLRCFKSERKFVEHKSDKTNCRKLLTIRF